MSLFAPLYRPLWQGRTYAVSAYLLWSLVTSILWLTLVVSLYATSIGLAVLWVGVPLLVMTHRSVRWIGDIERRQVNAFLGLDVPPYPPLELPPFRYNDHPRIARFGTWMHTVFHDCYTWRALAWIGLRIILGPVGFALAIVVWVTLLSLALAPLSLLFAWSDLPAGYEGLAWLVAAGPVAAVILAPILVWSIKGWAGLHAMVARWALGPGESERTKAAEHRAEVAEQQVRIDQELHDSIGHILTMTVVQAGAAAHVFDDDPDFARRALSTIEQRGRAALDELDRIIATLRGDDGPVRQPLPGVENIPELIQTSRDAGMDIEAVVAEGVIPVALGRAVYRIVREALTNAAKHAPGAAVHVHVERMDDAVAVAVVNAAPATAPAQSAPEDRNRSGLRAVRDRVALLGGVADAGPTEEGGFAVRALVPVGTSFEGVQVDDVERCCAWSSLRAKVVL